MNERVDPAVYVEVKKKVRVSFIGRPHERSWLVWLTLICSLCGFRKNHNP